MHKVKILFNKNERDNSEKVKHLVAKSKIREKSNFLVER